MSCRVRNRTPFDSPDFVKKADIFDRMYAAYKKRLSEDGNKKTLFTLDSKLTFGKYKGLTVLYLSHQNPEYLEWVKTNVNFVEFDEEAYKTIMFRAHVADQNRVALMTYGYYPRSRVGWNVTRDFDDADEKDSHYRELDPNQ